MFTELIEKSQHHTNLMIPFSELVVRKERKFEAYCSLFPYSDGIIDHLRLTTNEDQKTGTLSGFEGDVFCRTIWFDIDCEEAPAYAHRSTCELVNRLLNKYRLKKEHLTIFFSGSKGFHVSFSAKHVGGFNPCNELPYQIKRFVERISEGIDYIDLSIYNLNRFFRLPFSKHSKTGLFKMPLTVEELESNNILKIREMAKKSRIDFKFENPRQIVKNSMLEKDWLLSKSKPEIAKVERDLLENFPVDQEAVFSKAVEMTTRKGDYAKGNRNNFVFQLAAWCNDLGYGEEGDAQLTVERVSLYLHDIHGEVYLDVKEKEFVTVIESAYRRLKPNFGQKQEYLKTETNYFVNEKTKLFLMDKAQRLARVKLSKREIVEYLLALNATKKFPIKEEEVYTIVTSYAQDSNERREDDYGSTMPALAAEYYVQVINARNDFGIGLELIDEIEENDYASKVIAIIGKAGTKKSILLKEIMRHVCSQGFRSIYSTMEDGKIGQFKRFLASSFQPEEIPGAIGERKLISAAKHFKWLIKNRPDKAKDIVQANAVILEEMYGDRLIIDEKGGMKYDDYSHFIDKIIAKCGAIELLGIDGLSMMGSHGNELQSDIENSKKTKELANKYKICVPLLIHVPKSVGRTERDLYDHCRNGGKLVDNADIFISLSQVYKQEHSDSGIREFDDNLLYVSYWGKRTSGARLRFMMELDPVTLKLSTRHDLDVKIFDEGY